jgi:hypothetical protein
MKLLPSIALLSLVAGCATNRELRSLRDVGVSGSGIASGDVRKVRTPEIVKAYPVGRYSDPNFPNQMHERHTLYRREQAAEWNYRPTTAYALPLGPVVAEFNPSSSSYSKTNSEQVSAQQKAHAEALLEQNVCAEKANRRTAAERLHDSESPERNRTTEKAA